MNSSHRNQLTDLQPKFSSVWCIFCWEAPLSRLYMSYLVLICCLVEFAVLIIFVYLHMLDYSSHCCCCTKAFITNYLKKSNFSNNILPFYSLCWLLSYKMLLLKNWYKIWKILNNIFLNFVSTFLYYFICAISCFLILSFEFTFYHRKITNESAILMG